MHCQSGIYTCSVIKCWLSGRRKSTVRWPPSITLPNIHTHINSVHLQKIMCNTKSIVIPPVTDKISPTYSWSPLSKQPSYPWHLAALVPCISAGTASEMNSQPRVTRAGAQRSGRLLKIGYPAFESEAKRGTIMDKPMCRAQTYTCGKLANANNPIQESQYYCLTKHSSCLDFDLDCWPLICQS